MNQLPADYRAGYVTIIGRPNAGKSTLMNVLLETKLSIISHKPQTTRRRVVGILNRPKYQAIFLDTPGIIKPRYRLQQKMMDYLQAALKDADLLFLIVDAAERSHPQVTNLADLNPSGTPVILLLNKIDRINKEQVLPLIDYYRNHFPFECLIPISAIKHDGLDRIEEEMVQRLPLSPPYYPPDQISDQPERFFVAEIIREKVFEYYHQEIPYSVDIQIEQFQERQNRKDYIYAVIMVERKSQKSILIGKHGETLKRVGTNARHAIETFLGRGVFLDLKVKVAEGWRKDELKLRRLGY